MRFFYMRKSGVSFFATTFLCAFLAIPQVSFAAETPAGAFVVRPAKVELEIAPGTSALRTLSLTNSTALPLRVSVSFEDVASRTQASATDDPIVLLGANGGAYPLRTLVRTPTDSLIILSGQTIGVPVTVDIPKDATPGGHYGSVVFTFTPIFSSGAVPNESVAVESRLATLFYVRVSGNAKEEGSLLEFGLFNNAKTTPAPTSEHPLRFQVAFMNTGNVHLNPYGRISLTSFFSKDEEVIIDPWVVLPSGTRMREIDFHGDLRMGYYTAHLEQNRGYQDIIDTREVHFFVLPSLLQALLMSVGLLLFVFIIRRSLLLSRHTIS